MESLHPAAQVAAIVCIAAVCIAFIYFVLYKGLD